MATTRKPLAFKNALSLYGQDTIFHTVGDHKYACMTLNTGSKSGEYDYKENEIKFTCSYAAGYVEGSEVWFLAKVPKDFKGKLVDLTVKGKDFKPDKEKTDADSDLWENGKQLIAIDCKDIPPLKILAEVLHELKIIGAGIIRIALNSPLDDLKEASSEFYKFLLTEFRFPMSSDAVFSKLSILQNSTGMLNPFTEKFPLPETPEINEFGFPTGNMIIDAIPFEGEFPNIEKFIFSIPPKPEQKSNGGRSWGGSTSVNVEGYQAKEAWEFVKTNFDDIKEFFCVDQSSAILITLSLAGVNALPTIQPMIKESWSPEKLIKANGHKPNPITEDQAETKGDTGEVEKPSETIEQHIIRRFTTLKLDHAKWLSRHKDNDEREYICKIIESPAFLKFRTEIEQWCGDQLGTDLPVPITALPKKAQIEELLNLIKDTEAKMEIDPKTSFVGAS